MTACQTIADASNIPFGQIVLVLIGFGVLAVILTLIKNFHWDEEQEGPQTERMTQALVGIIIMFFIGAAIIGSLGC